MVYLKLQNVTLSNNKKRRFRQTPVLTLQGLQRLLVILGGKVAAEFRQIVEGVFTRYMAGDRTMIQDINSNALSDAPIHQAYRQALAQEPESTRLEISGSWSVRICCFNWRSRRGNWRLRRGNRTWAWRSTRGNWRCRKRNCKWHRPPGCQRWI